MHPLAISPDGAWLAAYSSALLNHVRDRRTGQAGAHLGPIGGAYFSPDGRWIAGTTDDGTVRVWDRESGDCTEVHTGEPYMAREVVFSPDGGWLVTTGHRDARSRSGTGPPAPARRCSPATASWCTRRRSPRAWRWW